MINRNNAAKDTAFLGKNKNRNISILAFVGCLLLAFIIWTYVMNVKISDNRKTFTIKMDIRGEVELLNDSNYSIFGASETWVKVTVQGTNADLNQCSEKDFGVYIDVSSIEKTGITPLNIVVESRASGITVVSTDPVQTTVFADERINEKQVPISVQLADGLELEENTVIKLDKEVLSVSGPKTYVGEIAYAKLIVSTLDFGYSDENIASKVVFPAAFYDVAGNLIESPYIVYNTADVFATLESYEPITETPEAN